MTGILSNHLQFKLQNQAHTEALGWATKPHTEEIIQRVEAVKEREPHDELLEREVSYTLQKAPLPLGGDNFLIALDKPGSNHTREPPHNCHALSRMLFQYPH